MCGRYEGTSDPCKGTLGTMRIRVMFASVLLAVSLTAYSQEIRWTDAACFPLYGKACTDTPALYDRLPARLESSLRAPVWKLGRNSAGL